MSPKSGHRFPIGTCPTQQLRACPDSAETGHALIAPTPGILQRSLSSMVSAANRRKRAFSSSSSLIRIVRSCRQTIDDLGACTGHLRWRHQAPFAPQATDDTSSADSQRLGNPDLRDSLSMHSIAWRKLCIDLHGGVFRRLTIHRIEPVFCRGHRFMKPING